MCCFAAEKATENDFESAKLMIDEVEGKFVVEFETNETLLLYADMASLCGLFILVEY